MLSSSCFSRHFLGVNPVSFQSLVDSALFYLKNPRDTSFCEHYRLGARFVGGRGALDRAKVFSYFPVDRNKGTLACEYALTAATRALTAEEYNRFQSLGPDPECFYLRAIYEMAILAANQPNRFHASLDRGAAAHKSGQKSRYQSIIGVVAFSGFPPAQLEYARFLWPGQDRRLAVKLIRSAAESGYSEAMYAYGRLRLSGLDVPRDPKSAYKYFSEAAKTGNLKAAFFQGLCLWDGVGVKRNEDKAVKLFTDVYQKGLREGLDALHLIDDWRKKNVKGYTPPTREITVSLPKALQT